MSYWLRWKGLPRALRRWSAKQRNALGGRSADRLLADQLALHMMAGRAADIAAMIRREVERSLTGEETPYRRKLLDAAKWVGGVMVGILITVGVTTDDLDTGWIPGLDRTPADPES